MREFFKKRLVRLVMFLGSVSTEPFTKTCKCGSKHAGWTLVL